jgi:outer membrane lipoprotein-sorting protein
MYHSSGLLLATLLLSPAADPRPEEVVARVQEYFSRMHAVHVVCTQRSVESGGMWTENPETSRVTYKADGFLRTYDLWLDPPKQRIVSSETRQQGSNKQTSSTQVYFDGKTYTYLNPSTRSGLVARGASQVKPPPAMTPVDAIGFCYPATFQSTLGALLADPSKLVVERHPALDGGTDWMIELKPLPGSLEIYEPSEKARATAAKVRRNTVVRLCVRLEPEVTIRRWGIFVAIPQNRDQKKSKLADRILPSLHLDGYVLTQGYVNCDFRQFRDELRRRSVLLPGRVFAGNANAVIENAIQDLVVNPTSAPETFSPKIPAGYSITYPADEGKSQAAESGGPAGESVNR